MSQNNNSPIGFSLYQLSLLSFLRESHPEKARHITFIKNRSIDAAQAYAEAFDSGFNIDQCVEKAMKRLYQGLHFSKHDTITNILWSEFSREVDSPDVKGCAIRLQPYLESYFERYTLTDDFAYSIEFESLRTELIGAI